MGKPPHHGWIANYEEEVTLSEAITNATGMFELLKKHGKFKISQGKDKITVEPPKRLTYICRYERLPRGEYALKLELKWDPGAEHEPPSSGGAFKIEAPS
jgi:hypothetical protein